MAQLASEYGVVHPNQIGQWEKRLLEDLPSIFSDGKKTAERDQEELEAELYCQIGQREVDVEWLKKVSAAR